MFYTFNEIKSENKRLNQASNEHSSSEGPLIVSRKVKVRAKIRQLDMFGNGRREGVTSWNSAASGSQDSQEELNRAAAITIAS